MHQKKIKLVQVTADAAVGGGSSHILGLLQNLDFTKFEISLICPSGYLSKEAKKISGLQVFNIPMKSKFDLVSIFSLKKILEQIEASGDPFGPMIIHSHGPRANLFVAISAPNLAIKLYTEHIYNYDYRLKSWFNNFVQKKLMSFCYKRNNLVLAVSSSVKSFLVQTSLLPEDRVVVVPNGIDLAKFQSKTKKIKTTNLTPVIGTVGSLNKEKSQSDLITAFATIVKRYPLARLEIVGEGNLKQELKELALRLKISRNVAFLGRKSDVVEYLRKWDVFVLSSKSETFGIAALEALAAGVPVVASNVGGIPDIIENRQEGILVSSGAPEEIAKAVIELIEHPAFAASLKRRGLAKAKAYSWKNIVKKIEEIYLILVG
ncbi:MAG: glycosyltransferase family 4 protein [Candidatus Berkelbacteria bacterium]|nr:glycosyltransferase family 4 protein [Candidatus Berkelbacteria bacterium]